MPRRLCLTNLIVAEELITGTTDQGEPVDVVYLEFSKDNEILIFTLHFALKPIFAPIWSFLGNLSFPYH